MEIVTSGYIGSTETPFSLLAPGETFADELQGKAAITAFVTGALLSSSIGSQGDNHTYASVPSLWKGTVAGVGAISKIAMSGDLGVGVGVNDFNGVRGLITAGSAFPTNNYTNIEAPDMGCIYIAAKPNAIDAPINFDRYTYESGEMFRMRWDAHNVGWFFFSKFGACYFFLTNPGKLGYLPPESRIYTNVAELAAMTMYSLQAVTATAQGTVHDPAGNPAQNCRVLAFSRDDDRLVGRAVSGHDGTYTLHLNAYKGEMIYMVCLDNVEAPDFEAQIIDRIVV